MKTTSLELSKELKEAGFPQESYLSWMRVDEEYILGHYSKGVGVSAPTAEEILDLLPLIAFDGGGRLTVVKLSNDDYEVKYGRYVERGATLAEASANMWLWLKAEGIL